MQQESDALKKSQQEIQRQTDETIRRLKELQDKPSPSPNDGGSARETSHSSSPETDDPSAADSGPSDAEIQKHASDRERAWNLQHATSTRADTSQWARDDGAKRGLVVGPAGTWKVGAYHVTCWGSDRLYVNTYVFAVIVNGDGDPDCRGGFLQLENTSEKLPAFRQHSRNTSGLLGQLFERFQKEGVSMAFTMEDFQRQYAKEHFADLTPEDQQEVLQALPPEKQQEVLNSLPPETRLAGLSAEQIRHYLDQLTANRPAEPRKPRRKK